jgi:hypothetical protein
MMVDDAFVATFFDANVNASGETYSRPLFHASLQRAI